MKKISGLRVIGVGVGLMLVLQVSYGGLEEQFRQEYPAAAKKLEDAYRQVTIKLKRTRTVVRDEAAPERWVETNEIMRDGGSCLRVRRVVESNAARWPVGSVAYEGGSAGLSFEASRRPRDTAWLFNSYGADARFEKIAMYQIEEPFTPYCLDDMKLSEVLGKRAKILSVSAVQWDGAEAIAVAADFSKDVKRVIRFYFQPETWALLGWEAGAGGEADMRGVIRYEKGSSPPRLSRIETWNAGMGEGIRIEGVEEVTGLTFGPVAKEKFRLEGWGLKPPPLDLIGDAVPAIEDIEGEKCAVDAAAEKVLGRLVKAYDGVTSAELHGTVNVTAKGDDEQTASWEFAAYFDGGRYRHVVDRRFCVGRDEQRVYAYAANLNGHLQPDSFVQIPRAVAESNSALVPDLLAEVLDVQDPVLGLLAAKDRREMILRGGKRVQKMADVEAGGVKCEQLLVRGAKRGWSRRLLVDASSGQIREARFTMATASTDAAPGKDLSIVVRYDKCDLGAKVEGEKLLWKAPEGSRNLSPRWARLIGQPAPEVTFRMLDGKRVALSSMKGKLVVLDFWASWCAPCRYTLPHVQELYAAHHAQGLEVVAVNLQERPEKLQAFLKDFEMKSPVALDRDGSILRTFGGGGIPLMVVIGPDGVVKEAVPGASDASMNRLTQLVEDGVKELKP
jgi:thiol-disulfide isomerase/thioredoxin